MNLSETIDLFNAFYLTQTRTQICSNVKYHPTFVEKHTLIFEHENKKMPFFLTLHLKSEFADSFLCWFLQGTINNTLINNNLYW